MAKPGPEGAFSLTARRIHRWLRQSEWELGACMKRTVTTTLAATVLALWLGYYLGYHNGVRQERRAWLATEQILPEPTPTVAAGRPAIQTSRWTRTFYTYPHSGQTFYASFGRRPVNVPDPRDTPTR
jgi:hypothetical protein